MKPKKQAPVYTDHLIRTQNSDHDRFVAMRDEMHFIATELEEVGGEIGINFGCGHLAEFEEEEPYGLDFVNFSISRGGTFYFYGPSDEGKEEIGLDRLVYENKKGEIATDYCQGISKGFKERFTQKVKL